MAVRAVLDCLADCIGPVGITCDLKQTSPKTVKPGSRILAMHVNNRGACSLGQDLKDDQDVLFINLEKKKESDDDVRVDGERLSVRSLHTELTAWCKQKGWNMHTLLAQHNIQGSAWAKDEEARNFAVFFALSPRPITLNTTDACALPGPDGSCFDVYDIWDTMSATPAQTDMYSRRTRAPLQAGSTLGAIKSILDRAIGDLRAMDRDVVTYT